MRIVCYNSNIISRYINQYHIRPLEIDSNFIISRHIKLISVANKVRKDEIELSSD